MNPRLLALEVLAAVERGRRLDAAFADAADDLPDRDRRWIHELLYGVQRLRGRLDHLIEVHASRPAADVTPVLLRVLRLGSYQALHMGSVPAYAAVSESVALAKRVAPRGAGFVNAVLRRLVETGEDRTVFPGPDRDPEGFLSTWHSHPRWLVDRWLARWDYETTLRTVELDNRPPGLYVVPVRSAPEEAVERLELAGIVARVADAGTVEILDGTPRDVLARLDAYVQDPGAASVSVFSDPPQGALLVDLCAAPGGKCLGLTARSERVVAADRSVRRLGYVRENLERCRRKAWLVAADATAPPFVRAPFVLLDVPCSGTGTLRRHPDARWRLTPGDIESLAALQGEMLDAAAALVDPGGVLVYATCTLEPEENDDQVEAFLSRAPAFERDRSGAAGDGILRVLPHESGFDGAFAARLRRTV